MKAKEKAIKFLETKCKWCKDWEEIQEVKDVIKTIDIAIKEAKKEVFDDILTDHLGLRIYDLNASISVKKIYDSKKRHLSTSEKKKELNSSSKKDCLENHYVHSDGELDEGAERSPS